MYMVEIFLPLRDNEGHAFPRAEYDRVRAELTERFGGATAHLRAPAAGTWKDDGDDVARDEIVIVEAMAEELDREWWQGYRRELEQRFRQDVIVVRAIRCETL